MSPIPSPVPLRRTVARLLFSPTGLLFAFVVLLLTTCPGARGQSGFDQLLAMEVGAMATDITTIAVPVAPSSTPRVIGRSTRFDRPRESAAQAPAAVERGARAGAGADPLRDARLSIPLLDDSLFDEAAGNLPPRIRPMTGPAVGIEPRLPNAAR